MKIPSGGGEQIDSKRHLISEAKRSSSTKEDGREAAGKRLRGWGWKKAVDTPEEKANGGGGIAGAPGGKVD